MEAQASLPFRDGVLSVVGREEAPITDPPIGRGPYPDYW